MLINEKHLNMRDLESRQLLQSEMEKFLADEHYQAVEGYVPPES
jgi:Fe-S cluster biosynthesis and repair protein YggX